MSFPKIYDLRGTNVGIDVILLLLGLMPNCFIVLADKVEDFVLLVAIVSFMLLF